MSLKSRMECYSSPTDLVLKKIQELKQKGFSQKEAEDFAILKFLPEEANLTKAEQKRLAEYEEKLTKYS